MSQERVIIIILASYGDNPGDHNTNIMIADLGHTNTTDLYQLTKHIVSHVSWLKWNHSHINTKPKRTVFHEILSAAVNYTGRNKIKYFEVPLILLLPAMHWEGEGIKRISMKLNFRHCGGLNDWNALDSGVLWRIVPVNCNIMGRLILIIELLTPVKNVWLWLKLVVDVWTLKWCEEKYLNCKHRPMTTHF